MADYRPLPVLTTWPMYLDIIRRFDREARMVRRYLALRKGGGRG